MAIIDIREWLGGERFEILEKEFKKYKTVSPDTFRLWMSITGISGYPVEAWYRSLWGNPEEAVRPILY